MNLTGYRAVLAAAPTSSAQSVEAGSERCAKSPDASPPSADSWRSRYPASAIANGSVAAVRFHDSVRFHPLSSSWRFRSGSPRLERALESHDGHQERIWVQPEPAPAADAAVVSDECEPESVGWRMEQQEIQGRPEVRSVRSAGRSELAPID